MEEAAALRTGLEGFSVESKAGGLEHPLINVGGNSA
jgi:hypothetical protein